MSGNEELDSKLVDLVRANPMLYEKELRNSPYESMKRKTEIWKSIAGSLGVEPRYCTIRWKNLRDKFRRELQKSNEIKIKAANAGSTWELLEKMRFLESHIKYYSMHATKSQTQQQQQHSITTVPWNDMEAEQLIEELQDDDDPLQEAMDEQSTSIAIREKMPNNTTTTTIVVNHSSAPVNMKRMEALLEGLDDPNRYKAEKRIVAYLCKCQLKALNNEDIDDVIV